MPPYLKTNTLDYNMQQCKDYTLTEYRKLTSFVHDCQISFFSLAKWFSFQAAVLILNLILATRFILYGLTVLSIPNDLLKVTVLQQNQLPPPPHLQWPSPYPVLPAPSVTEELKGLFSPLFPLHLSVANHQSTTYLTTVPCPFYLLTARWQSRELVFYEQEPERLQQRSRMLSHSITGSIKNIPNTVNNVEISLASRVSQTSSRTPPCSRSRWVLLGSV